MKNNKYCLITSKLIIQTYCDHACPNPKHLEGQKKNGMSKSSIQVQPKLETLINKKEWGTKIDLMISVFILLNVSNNNQV